MSKDDFPSECVTECVEIVASANCDAVSDPALDWAAQNPEKFLTYLYVHPHPCGALEALFSND